MQRGGKGVSDSYLKAQHQLQQGFGLALIHCPGLCYSGQVIQKQS